MTTFQRLIKYLAIAFGIFITGIIISSIVFVITAVLGISTGFNTYVDEETVEVIDFSESYANVNNLDLDVSISNLNITTGETFMVEASNVGKDFKCELVNKTLKIKENDIKNNIFSNTNHYSTITIYIPENIKLNEVIIDTGISTTSIENLLSDKLDLDLGMGNFEMRDSISNKTEISTGAGEVVLTNVQLGNLDLETGVGSCTLSGKLTGYSNIECGVGGLNINLEGEDYTIFSKTGIGNININGQKVDNNSTNGNGQNRITVEGGIGEVNINFNTKNE